jgi:RNA polymerase primary sigma factor
LLRDLQRQLRKSYHEHILIHYCDTPRKQVWQWATLDGRRRIQHREHPFFSDSPPPRLLERLHGLAISFAEEEQVGLTDVLDRVRTALKPDAEQNLFANMPWYAAQSDRLAMAVKAGEPGAIHRLIEFHMPLARKQSRRLKHWFDLDPDDAEQIAMIGLIQAAKRFDPERGYQFSTYAGHWIRNACQRYGLEWGLPMHVPTHFFWNCYKLEFIETELIAAHGVAGAREPFAEALKESGVSREQWEHFRLARNFQRLSELDRQELRRIDRPEPTDSEPGDELPFQELISDALQKLHPRQAEILRMRYGFDQPEHTLQEIADKFGLTRERIRQLQSKAEAKLLKVLQRPDAKLSLEVNDFYTHEASP